MAKKKGNFSYIEAREALEAISATATKESIPYDLLRVFCGYGDASLARVADGRGNDAKDGKTILIKKLLAYRCSETNVFGDEDLYAILDDMRATPSISKKEPRLYIASDGTRIVAYDPKEDDIYDNDISLLWKDFEFFKPLAGIEKFKNTEESEADVKSAEMMAKIYDDIRRYNNVTDKEQVHNINVFMTRLLFCFFAEDTGLFPVQNMFTHAIEHNTKADGSDIAEFIEGIFDVMAINDGEVRASLPNVISQFPYVNGGLFQKHIPIPIMSRRTRMLMLRCGEYNWAEINPDIFGSMIQAVVNPDDRAGLGMHYTSVPNIMKVIKPLFLDDLTDEFIRSKEDERKLRLLLARLSKIKFFDPACGSGNFLIIAYKAIRELEIQIWKQLQSISGGQAIIPFSEITLQQFYGIEIDEYACDTAILSLWLAEHQMNNIFHRDLGTRPDALPLRPSGNIVCGNACRLDWNTVCPHTIDEEVYIMGNPPYLGSSMQDTEQKLDLTLVCGGFDSYKNLDYIACWFILGTKYLKETNAKLSFVSTNSICQGEQVAMLWNPIFKMGINIEFAYKSFKWSNSAKNNAGVSVIIVGLSSKKIRQKTLYFNESKFFVENINAYLLNAPNIIIDRLNKPISQLPNMVFGNKPTDGGFLILDETEYNNIIQQYPNAKSLIRYYHGADSFINGTIRYCLWINDEDVSLANSIPLIKKRLEKVSEFRNKSKAESTVIYANKPHLFKQRAHQESLSLIIPRVSSERRTYIPIGFLNSNTIISDSAQAVYNADVFIFGIITSYIHMLWAKTIGGKLETRYRYTNLCYNSFPFPKISNEQKDRLTTLAENILLVRENHTEMTLGEMYNPESMPMDLKVAHQALDIAVEQCYRTEPFTSDEERLEYLFKLYEKMTKKK
ncbi:MAG: class I SAM-dependent DNA methyltransferase [Muribaculaceae bacterium]|nr:class I SAM-dependent DNA methyltransferase [Muribaculaceae bacterium]